MGRNTDVWVIDAAGGALTKISDHDEPATTRRAGRPTARRSRSSARYRRKCASEDLAGRQRRRRRRRASRPTALDLIPTALRWADDGKALYFETGFKGTSQLFRVDLAARKARRRSRPAIARCTSSTSTRRRVALVYAVNDPTHLDDLYVADLRRPQRKAAHAPERGAVEAAQLVAGRARAVQGRRRLGRRRLLHEADRLASRQEISDGPEHPRRPGRHVRLRLVPRVPGLRGARLGGVLHQPARLDRLRREVRARHRAELGRQGLRRRHERRGRGAREVPVDRSRIASASPAAATAAT